jgi:hypothetical protein
VAKSALAAGLSWSIARAVTDLSDPVLAPLTALVVGQVSVRASVRAALQRSAGVVLGVLLALALGDLFGLNGLTVAVLVALSLGVAELVLRLPAAAAIQIPISILVVLTAVAASPVKEGWNRALDTIIGAAVGVIVSLVLPASRLRGGTPAPRANRNRRLGPVEGPRRSGTRLGPDAPIHARNRRRPGRVGGGSSHVDARRAPRTGPHGRHSRARRGQGATGALHGRRASPRLITRSATYVEWGVEGTKISDRGTRIASTQGQFQGTEAPQRLRKVVSEVGLRAFGPNLPCG